MIAVTKAEKSYFIHGESCRTHNDEKPWRIIPPLNGVKKNIITVQKIKNKK